jgi:competence protein ComEC
MQQIASLIRRLGATPPGALFVAVCWGVQQLPALPGRAASFLLLALGLAMMPLGRPAMVIGTGLVAAGWATLRAEQRLAERLAPALEGRDLTVIGVVDELPQPFDRGLRFRLRIERCVAPRDATAPPAVRAGERWQLNVRLRRPHATLNPGLFDAELRALEDGVAANGHVRKGAGERANRRIDAFAASPRTVVERLRETLRDRMSQGLGGWPPEVRGVLIALVIGDQAAIPGRWWEVFNRTGIGHLMSISGLHITMLAALGAGLAGRAWKSPWLASRMGPWPLPSLLPVQYARWGFGLMVGFGYSALAGWGIPAQRTCWMLAIAGLALLGGRARSPVAVLSTAGAVVCALDPWAPLAAGFWLSFAAVAAIILYGSGRGHRPARDEAPARWRGAIVEALRTQYAATLVLLPLGVLFFSSVALVSPIANAFAIPLVSVLIAPLALAGAAVVILWAWAGTMLLGLAAWLTRMLLAALEWVDPGGIGSLAIASPTAGALCLSALGCMWLLSPIPVPGRAVGALALLPLLFTPADAPPERELRLTAIDIGQGMAVLVETGGRRLLYDTGPRIGADNDAGSRVIVPFLRARGIRALDALVVSHLDLDHSGGALAVLRNLRVDWVASSLPADHEIVTTASRHFACRRGQQWRWGDARFEWLHPGSEPVDVTRSPTNARSCVLRIDTPAGSALLAGDIEAAQERTLLERFGTASLRADVLLAPHHGSTTSSTPAFLDAVAPAVAIFQVGYRNRYRHPNPKVLDRYIERGIEILRSDAHAAITLRLRAGEPPRATRWRLDERRYWRVRLDAGAG